MTLVDPRHGFKCDKCQTVTKIPLYGSVNVTFTPDLLKEVFARKINNFRCDGCGFNAEIAQKFLFADNEKKLYFNVFPIELRGRELEPGEQTKTVFGYDELFSQIKKYYPEYDTTQPEDGQ